MQIGDAVSFGNPGDSISVKLPNGQTIQAIAGNVINSSKILLINGYAFSETSPQVELTRSEVYASKGSPEILEREKAIAIVIVPEFWGLAVAYKGNRVFSFGLSLGHYQSFFDMGLGDFQYDSSDRQDIHAGIIRLTDRSYKGWIVLPDRQSFYRFSGTATRIYPDLEEFPSPSPLLPTAEHDLTTTLIDNSGIEEFNWQYSYYGENFILSNIGGIKKYYQNYPISPEEQLISGADFEFDPSTNFDQDYINPYNLNYVKNYTYTDDNFNYLRTETKVFTKTGYTNQVDTFNNGFPERNKLYMGRSLLGGATYYVNTSTGEDADANYISTVPASCLYSSLGNTTTITGGIALSRYSEETTTRSWENDHYLYLNGAKIEGVDYFTFTSKNLATSSSSQDVTRNLECVEFFSSISQSRGGWRETSFNLSGSTAISENTGEMSFERKKEIMFPLTLSYSRKEIEVRTGSFEASARSVYPSWQGNTYRTFGGVDAQANIAEYEYLETRNYTLSKEKRRINYLVISSPQIAIWVESYEACEFESTSNLTRPLSSNDNNVIISYADRRDEFFLELGTLPSEQIETQTYDAQYEEPYNSKWFVVNNGNVQAMDLKTFCHRFYIEGDGISTDYDLYRNEQFPFDVTYFPSISLDGNTKYLKRVTSDRFAIDLIDVPSPPPFNVTPNTTYEYEDGQWAWLKTVDFTGMEVYIDTKDISDGTYRRYKGVISDFSLRYIFEGEDNERVQLENVTITVQSVEVMEYLFFVDYYVNTFYLGESLITNDIERLVAVAYTPSNCNGVFISSHFGLGAGGGNAFRDYRNYTDRIRRQYARFDGNILILSDQTPFSTPYSPELYAGYIQKLRLEGNKFVYDSIEKLFSYNLAGYFVSTSGYRDMEADLIRQRLEEDEDIAIVPEPSLKSKYKIIKYPYR